MKLTNVTIGFAAVAALWGCDSGTTGNSNPQPTTTATTSAPPANGPAKKTLKITMIAKSSSNPVFQAAKTGAEAAAAELSKGGETQVSIDWRTPNDEDGQEQARRIAQAVNDGTDCVLISCSDAAKVTGAIDAAVGQNVPVMTFDSDAPASKRFAFYGANDDAVGHEIMRNLVQVNGGKGTVAILSGNQNAPNLQKRVKGVLDEAAKTPGEKVMTTPFYQAEKPQDAAQAVRAAMNANPQIDSWAMVGGWPLFTTSLMDLDPTKIKIVAVDGLPEELPYVEKGIAPVLLAQPTYDWGYRSVNIIYDKLIRHKDVPTINEMKLVKVTKDSLGGWAHQLQKWGFKVPQKYLDMKSAP